ncbi:hypothetical protein AAMO2058_000218200 [Amorphochlora amoebiformis]
MPALTCPMACRWHSSLLAYSLLSITVLSRPNDDANSASDILPHRKPVSEHESVGDQGGKESSVSLQDDTTTYSYYSKSRIPARWVNTDDLSLWTKSPVSNVDDNPPEFLDNRLNFTFPFYGYDEGTSIWISPNGFISFAFRNCRNSFCGWTGEFNTRYIAPFMTDLNPANNNISSVYWQLGNEAGRLRLAVFWKDVHLWQGFFLPPFTFQVVIWDDGEINFNYKTASFNPAQSGLRRYPLRIGLEDSSLSQTPTGIEISNRYGLVEIEFADISTLESIQLMPLLDCRGPSNCSECARRLLSINSRIGCGWCPSLQTCTDPGGRDYANNLMAECGVREVRQSQLQCKLVNLSPERVDTSEGTGKSRSSSKANNNNWTPFPVLVGVGIGCVFFIVSAAILRAVYWEFCKRMTSPTEDTRRFLLSETKEWTDTAPDNEEDRELKLADKKQDSAVLTAKPKDTTEAAAEAEIEEKRQSEKDEEKEDEADRKTSTI